VACEDIGQWLEDVRYPQVEGYEKAAVVSNWEPDAQQMTTGPYPRDWLGHKGGKLPRYTRESMRELEKWNGLMEHKDLGRGDSVVRNIRGSI
jgi:hypothetical protein